MPNGEKTMNAYRNPIENFFNRISYLQGTLFHLESALSNYLKIRNENFKNSLNDNKVDFELGSSLVISDLTGVTDNGWPLYYPTQSKYILTISSYETETINLIKRETSYCLAQGYEAFEKFLKEILSLYFEENTQEAIKQKLLDQNENTNSINWKEKLKSGKNNNELFKLIRKISNLEVSEKNNFKQINLNEWYEVYSLFRHSITHSEGKLLKDNKDFKKFNANQIKYLKKYFTYEDCREYIHFSIPRKLGNTILEILSEYAFMIFKELSIKSNQDWEILKYMKK